MPTPPPAGDGPYRVEQLDTDAGPAWRLAGPGLSDAKAYPHTEFRDKLGELARVMNFAWRQARADPRGGSTSARG